MITVILICIIAYLLGSIPTSFIFGKLTQGIDLRKYGSGNVGATNALRVLGTPVGLLTLLIDLAKGFFPVFIVQNLLPSPDLLLPILAALAAILGHIFTIFLKFKGGKGVATSAGAIIALAPEHVLVALTIFLIIVILTRFVSLGSIIAALSLFILQLIQFLQTDFDNSELFIFISFVVIFILIKHRANIKRLLQGKENKISFKKG